MIKLLKRLLPSPPAAQPDPPIVPEPEKPTAYTIRLGRTVKTDEAFDAWTSGDLAKMLAALNSKSNKIDRHFLLMSIVDATYKKRSDPEMSRLCRDVAELHLREFPNMVKPLKKEMGGTLPRVTTFQNYATLLTELGETDRAIGVCEQAISYGLQDGTLAGFEGRIERIKKAKASQ
ncbi:MAG TPA: hypothetical protein VFQ84_07405 [Arenimonas sp.]|uniref:hypothetical protein n=1 Tax=Arenimonas sp. TaxID=1872635 RepID=UPI002D7F86F1|nr:hypothetical protein [Arenimonas sp.]HEU0153153.1 hypothetical protein [Arenimonas sp.]